MKQDNIIKVIKQDREIYFFMDDLKNLFYEVRDLEKKLLYKEMVSADVEEYRIFVENEDNLYVVFKQNEELKCALINKDCINIGILYSDKDNLYDINEVDIFILNEKINIIAVLKEKDPLKESFIVHYIYTNGNVESNTICPIYNDNQKQHYKYILDIDSIIIFYSKIIDNKECIYFKVFNNDEWSKEQLLYELSGNIYYLDVKEKENELYLGIIHKKYDISVLKILIFNDDFNLILEKTYYDVGELLEVNLVEQDNEIFMQWDKNNESIITSSLINEKNIKNYKIKSKENRLIIFEINEVKNNHIYKYKSIGYKVKEEYIKPIDIKSLIKGNKVTKDDILAYSKKITKNLDMEKDRENNVINKLQFKLEKLQEELLLKQEQVDNLSNNIEQNEIKNLEQDYESRISKLIKEKQEAEDIIINLTNEKQNLGDKNNMEVIKQIQDIIVLKDELKNKDLEIEELSNKIQRDNLKNIKLNNSIEKFTKQINNLNKTIEQLQGENHKLLQNERKYNISVNRLHKIEETDNVCANKIKELQDENRELLNKYTNVKQMHEELIKNCDIKSKEKENLLKDPKSKYKNIFEKLIKRG